MPLYEYKCHECGKTFEVLQKFSDEPIRTHEECGGETERLISAPAFHLKGSGWYATDYAKSNGNAPKPDGKSGDGKSGDSKSGDGNSSESGSEKKASKEASSDSGSSSRDSKPAASEPKPAPATSSESK